MSKDHAARVLVLVPHDNQSADPICARLISAAQAFKRPVDLLVTGSDTSSVAKECTQFDGVEHVLVAQHESLSVARPEMLTTLLAPLMQQQYESFLAPANSLGHELVPRLAALLNVSPLSDVTRIMAPDLFERPIHAGAALVEIRIESGKKLMSLRAAKFPPMPLRAPEKVPAQIIPIEQTGNEPRAAFVIGQEFFRDQPALETAPIVLGLGRGAASKELFSHIEELAEQLGAVIGGTRTAVEMGLLPNNVQIGQTGKTIAPRLYIALGISGAAQHLAGIRDAQTIVAVNKDPDAPIFRIADFGLVGDLIDILPELHRALTGDLPTKD